MLSAFYIGHSGDTLGFLAGSLDLPETQSVRHQYYRHSDELCTSIIDTANTEMNTSMQHEITKQYSLDLKKDMTIADVFDSQGNIFDHLPKVGIKIGFDFGWQKRSGGTKYDSASGHGFYIGLENNNIT